MNALLSYDAFSVSSDGSAPRTPSPGSSLALDDPSYAITSSPSAFDSVFDSHGIPSMSSFPPQEYMLTGIRHHASVDVAPWQNNMHGTPMLHPVQSSGGRGGLLQELYDHELPPDHSGHNHGHHDAYYHHSAEPQYAAGGADWSTPPTSSHGLPPMRSPHDNMVRRNTFPYVRHDQESNNGAPYSQQQQQQQQQHQPPHYVDHPHMLAPFGRPDMMYGEPMQMAQGGHMPLAAEPSALHAPRMEDGYANHMAHHDYRHGMDDASVKLEEGGPVMIPPPGFFRPPSAGMTMGYLSPHTGLPIQHTDDAASKETQYLRRRCFNCHTTEPPSWRRSTLNPGKIVCNKCGLYERTHLRPRPLRFDELRAGNKARKAATKTAPSPKQRALKKDSEALSRRASISSNGSSVGASSDWDDTCEFFIVASFDISC
jgi:GATA-binding protein